MHGFKKIGLQLPDGLLKYAPIIADAIESNTNARVIIMADVVYGGCCIDTDTNVDLIVHYGHSCIVRTNKVKVLYVFVDIYFDSKHLEMLIQNLINIDQDETCIDYDQNESTSNSHDNLPNSDLSLCKTTSNNFTILGTIQYRHVVSRLNRIFGFPTYQIKPLSVGEVLGCTSPKVKTRNIIFVGDGRFHLESLMLSNRENNYYRYCPFNKKMYREKYDYERLATIRKHLKDSFTKAKTIGIINGTLGNQGNPKILDGLKYKLKDKKLYVFEMSEIKPSNLSCSFIDGYVQICCTRLSTDWGNTFDKFVISCYDVYNDDIKEMNFYSNESNKPWVNS